MRNAAYLTGDATSPTTSGNKIIAHVCNDIGAWGKGFVMAISRRWAQPEAAYRAWHHDRENNDFALGAVQLVRVEPEIWVVNMIGQHDIKRSRAPTPLPPIRYDAVESALVKLAGMAAELNATVHMPRIGCGLAGGTWEQIGPIVERTLCAKDIGVFVCDFAEQASRV